jgi:ClpP class serine protease
LIFAGKKKTQGNMFQPLSKDDRTDLQREVDSFYAMLCDCVSLGRGHRLTAAKARATEAATFLGKDAVAAGLADTLGVFEDALSVARRAGVGATSYSVQLPKAAAALPAPAAQTKPDVAAGNHGWDDIVAKVNARQAQPKPAPTSSVSKKEVATAFARSIARIKGEPSDKRVGFGWDEIIERQNARLARERGIRK